MSFTEIPNKKQEQILELLEDFSIESVLTNPVVRKILSAEEIKRMFDFFNSNIFESSLENMQKHDITILTIFSKQFPKSLIDLPDRPLILYCKGNINLFDEKCFAIVGTRMPTAYGKIVTEKFAKKVGRKWICDCKWALLWSGCHCASWHC